jgi:hypothetical protein
MSTDFVSVEVTRKRKKQVIANQVKKWQHGKYAVLKPLGKRVQEVKFERSLAEDEVIGPIIRRRRRNLSPLELSMKYDHPLVGNGEAIVRLPKLPFGRHQNYNDEDQFSSRHFLKPNKSLSPTDRDYQTLVKKKSYLEKVKKRINS